MDFSREGFCPSWKIHRRDIVHLVKKSGGGGGIISTLQKTRKGLCPPIQK